MKKLLYEKHFDDNINEDAEEIFNYLYDPVNLFNDSDTIYILFGGAYSPDFFEDLIYLDDWKEAYLTYREDIIYYNSGDISILV